MITIENMSFGYGKKSLFRNLNLELRTGNIYGLLGKNGAGKTTLLKLITGLRFPRIGQCQVLGYDPHWRQAELLQEIYFLTEQFFVPAMPMALYVGLYAPFYPRFDSASFAAYAEEFELDTGKKLSEFSYGQKKKFLLAFGLATGCRLMLLDEPTNGLDIPSKSQFRRLLAQISDKERIILISTHQVRDMENLIDPVIILDEGQIIFQQNLQSVTERLCVHLQQEEPEPDVLYSDKVLGGYVVVRENKDGDETRVDLETLFNTVTNSKEKVQALFAEKQARQEGGQR